jgi:hypothetical protein
LAGGMAVVQGITIEQRKTWNMAARRFASESPTGILLEVATPRLAQITIADAIP